jgi:hypothetical protein
MGLDSQSDKVARIRAKVDARNGDSLTESPVKDSSGGLNPSGDPEDYPEGYVYRARRFR